MRCHYDDHLSIRKYLEYFQDVDILELGAGHGANTANLLGFIDENGGSLIVVSDGVVPIQFERGNLQWIFGVSYVEIPKLPEVSVDVCVLDTDHNGWTLIRELEELERVMVPGGYVLIHDTCAFRATSGYQQRYNCGVPYPGDEVAKGPPYGGALADMLSQGGKWELIESTDASQGATAIRRTV